MFGHKLLMDLDGEYGWMDGLKFSTRPRLGDPEGVLVEKNESEVLGETDGDVVERSERGCHSVKRKLWGWLMCG